MSGSKLTVRRVLRYLQRQMTATEVFESVTNGGASDFAEVVTILNGSGPWCSIGGLAVNCYVEPVYTVDADIVVVSANLPIIRECLARAGKGASKLNVQFTSDDRYQPFVERGQQYDVLGQKVPVAKLEDVVQGKIWAWQDATRRLSKHKKDELDLIRIGEAYPELRKNSLTKSSSCLAEVKMSLGRQLKNIFVARLVLLFAARVSLAQSDPASEPAVLAVAKVMPAVVNINTERVVRRQVRDPFEDFAARFFGNYRVRPVRCARLCRVWARVSSSIRPVTSSPTSMSSNARLT